jgi:nucleoside-diphosphate-sugar epimerase
MGTPLLSAGELPSGFADEETLEEFISRPTKALLDDISALDGDLIILGVAGKVGVCLARLAKRAAPGKRIVGVARFSDQAVRARLEDWGVETIKCDLLDQQAVEALPKLPNVIFMAGNKFGTVGNEPFAWAMNAHVPALVAQAFRDSRIVAFSTLCVYPFADVANGGCDESVAPTPLGEYANGCVARERMFQFFSGKLATPGRLIRLNYAIDLRYGVLFDVANWVRDGKEIDVTTPVANVIWHGDVNNQILRALRHCEVPAAPLNMGQPQATEIRDLAMRFGQRFGVEPKFTGREAETCWVNKTDLATSLFGPPEVPLEAMIEWVADWIERGMASYAKPTRYEVRDGRF